MAKLILKLNNDVLDHIEIKQGDMKIGRKPTCDVHIDNLAVSGEHANIFTIGDDSFVQDLNSTNGTFVSNNRITKHHLRNGDAIVIGKYSLVYLSDAASKAKEDFAKTVIINPSALAAAASAATSAAAAAGSPPAAAPAAGAGAGAHQAALFVLSGANSGKRIEVTKTVTNLGMTGKLAGTITRGDDGYTLAASSEGGDPPQLNGRPLPPAGAKLKNGDIIEVAGTRLQFYLK